MRVDNLFFAYDKEDIIKGISFDISKNKITTLMGANGCGKSTLFHLLTKNLKAKTGDIYLEDENINNIKLKDFAKRVSIVHQYNTAPKDLTIKTLVSYGRIPFFKYFQSKDSKEEDREIVNWALEVTNLSDLKDKQIMQLSGGQRQRAWIAMALAQKPQILFLDEPTTYLDVKFQIEILRLVKSLNQKYNMTIVMVLHDINQAIHYSDEIIGMKKGQMIFKGNPMDVVSQESIQDLYGINLKVKYIENQKYVLTV